jgi:hypothetical protein
MALQHLRSSTANKRPTPGAMSDGQLALNTNLVSPGLFFKDSNGDLVKVGPVHVGTTAPNVTPGAGGQAGNSKGEQWLDTSSSRYVFKIWDGTAWRSEDGEFVNVSGDTMTGALGIIAGTAAAPGVFFSGDPNTGIYSPGADQLAVATNGTGRLFINATGNVGVGTSAPISTAGYGGVTMNGADGSILSMMQGGSETFRVINATGYSFINTTGSTPLLFGTAATERLRLTEAGLVGIGTSSPAQRLTVFNPSLGVPATSGTTQTNGAVRIGATGTSGVLDFGIGAAGTNQWIQSTDSNNLSLGYVLLLNPNGGNVGIGTTSPAYAFVVSAAGASGIEFGPAYSGTANLIQHYSRSGSVYVDAVNDATQHRFQISGTERARIDSSGRLLVGTSTGYSGATTQIASATNSTLWLHLTEAPANIGSSLGKINFGGDTSSKVCARIDAQADAGWGAGVNPGRLVFSTTAAGDASPTEAMRINNEGIVLVRTTAAVGSTNRFQVSDGFGVSAPNGLSFNTTNAANVYVGSMSNGRSINATGTINASGADYAEYMVKCGDFSIAKGDVCGLTKEGLLTNVFADAIGFMVKSTNPSYVGNDTWVTPETIKDLAEPELEVERLRQQVDRIAFAGQVPVNVTGAAPGQYIVPIAAADGGITGIAKDEADLTFAEYMQAVGKVIAIENDGRARIIVKVA